MIGQFREKQDETSEHVRRMLDEHQVRLFSLQELPQVIEEIRQAPEQTASGSESQQTLAFDENKA